MLPKLPPLVLSERMGKENIHMHQSAEEEGEAGDGGSEAAEPDDQAIEDSIDAVIAQACAEHEPDPFAFSSGSESESNGFSSPRRLTIMEPCVTPKLFLGPPLSGKDCSTPLQLHLGPGNWTMDDSINEVLRKVNQGGGPAGAAAPMPQLIPDYLSSGSPSPPTPEPALLKALEEKIKAVPPLPLPPPADVKKKLKKELKTKLKSKKEKDKPKDKERAKLKEKSKDKSRDKGKELTKEAKLPPWKEDEELLFSHPRDFALMSEAPPAKLKSKEVDGSGRKDKEKHKDKKKDKERSSKKDKAKSKDKGKEEKQKLSALAPFGLADLQPLFSPAGCLRLPSMLPPLPPVLQEKEAKGGKEEEKKKDKKEKKKKKDKEKEREKAREKEREKEEKKREKEREKEKREKDKEKEKAKERIRLEKVSVSRGLWDSVRRLVMMTFMC